MYTQPKKNAGSILVFLALCLLMPITRLQAQMVDLNGNGMSDIWELLYGASGLDPNADTDGDGVINKLEAIAGTNPFDPNSAPRIAALVPSGTNVNVLMPCALGKQYQLQSLPSLSLGWSNATIESTLVARTGTVVTLTAPAGITAKFFRISISDVDTDGDGVNDWEEYQAGLDPTKPFSNGQVDVNGQPVGDYPYVVGRLASQNVVTIAATDPTANQPDPNQSPVNLGLLTVTRGGLPLNSITVNFTLGGPGPGFATEGVDHAPISRTLTFPSGVSSQTITVTPLANTNLMSPVLATVELLPGTGYTVGSASNASVVIYPSATPSGIGLTGQYYTNSSPTYSNSANFNPANLKMTRIDPTVDFIWGNTTNPIPNNGYYCVRWTGQVQPQYSETYYFDVNSDDGCRLWVNDQLLFDSWTNRSATDSIGTIALQAGVRYDIKLDYFQGTGSAVAHLSWYSPSQSKQVIPATRLYPASVPPAPSQVISPQNAYGFVGVYFSYTNVGANSAYAFTATGVPPGLSFNSTNGIISGYPASAGNYQVTLTASNSVGLGASVVDIQIFDTANASVVREVWTNAPGVNISDIPLNTPANLTNYLTTLEGITGFGTNYGERVRGYFTLPGGNNYTFWIAGSDSAELWISDNGEPVNKVRRAYVQPGGTAPRQWNLQPNQKSPWLTLVGGQPYYIEILHKAGTSGGDNWSVGWLQDPTGTNTVPSGVVPNYVLSRYFPPPPFYAPGTLYTANMLAEPGVSSFAMGSATLRLSADGTQAILKFSYSGLTSPMTGQHIHCDPYLSNPSQIMFDIDAATPQPDGSYVWNIAPVGTLMPADIVEIIQEGKAYINVHTVNYPAGEINGHFTLAVGTQTFTPPPPPPAWVDDHTNTNAAARFLLQATFGPSPNDVAQVQALGYLGWITNQFAMATNHHLPLVLANASPDPTRPYPSTLTINTWWQQSVSAPDQLRQRVAFALSEILVVSQNGVLLDTGNCVSSYYDTLLDNSFGNFRALLEAVTLSPAMGIYLDMRGNDVGNIITGLHANENYAREIQQLFSIGLNRMWPDGELVMDSTDSLVPTYTQPVVMGFASVFTGWNYHQANQANGRLPSNFSPPANYTQPMVLVPTHHELGTKLLLDNVVLPQAWGSQADLTSTNFDNYGLQDLESALDNIFYNQNVGPFVCRQLIQRLVTSNPSRDYLYRVVQAFNDDGTGTRGNMQAVIKAILLDYEARSTDLLSQPTFGKQREPLLRVTAPARAFAAPAPLGGTYAQTNTATIAVTLTNNHRLNNSDTVLLSFTDTSGQPAPPTQGYSVTVTGQKTFTVGAPGLSTGSYGQTNNVLTVNIGGNGVASNNLVYLQFTSGPATSGVYQVTSVISSSQFTVATPDSTTNNGACLIPKLTGGGFVVQSHTNITVDAALAHGLAPGNSVFLAFSLAGSPASGQYQVVTVPDATHFTAIIPSANNQTQNGLTVYPLVAPALQRSGNVVAIWNTWNMGFTDNGSSSSLAQSPLNSPTVFNFFYPSYEFPGILASAGLTTPEFQLTSDTTVDWQMNFLENGILNVGNNTNGLSSFASRNGAIVLDVGAWMTTNYTSNAGIPSLVDSLSSLLLAGQLSPSARTYIINYVANTTNLPYSTPPTYSQMRDRVQAVVHLLATSPDFTVQK